MELKRINDHVSVSGQIQPEDVKALSIFSLRALSTAQIDAFTTDQTSRNKRHSARSKVEKPIKPRSSMTRRSIFDPRNPASGAVKNIASPETKTVSPIIRLS